MYVGQHVSTILYPLWILAVSIVADGFFGGPFEVPLFSEHGCYCYPGWLGYLSVEFSCDRESFLQNCNVVRYFVLTQCLVYAANKIKAFNVDAGVVNTSYVECGLRFLELHYFRIQPGNLSFRLGALRRQGPFVLDGCDR